MLQLTPLEQTVAGQQLFNEGKEEGIVQGELIGQIRLVQSLLKQPITSKEELVQKSIHELKSIFSQLKTELD